MDMDNNIDTPIEEENSDWESELYLSTDGKHTIKVKATTQEGRKAAHMWAKKMFDRLMFSYGTKQAQAVKVYGQKPVVGQPQASQTPTKLCTIHQVQMKQFSKNGRIWFSHGIDNPNGIIWCNGVIK